MAQLPAWRRIQIGSHVWPIYVREWIRKMWGYCNLTHKRIFLRKTQVEWEDTLLHEVLHACIEESKAKPLLEKWFGPKAHRREEQLVRAITPVLLGALKELGWRPPPPDA